MSASKTSCAPVQPPPPEPFPAWITNVATYCKKELESNDYSGHSYEQQLDRDQSCYMKLPIKKICGLKVDVILKLFASCHGKKHNLHFSVVLHRSLEIEVVQHILYQKYYLSHSDLVGQNGRADRPQLLTLHDYELFVKTIYDTLPLLQINVINVNLTTDKQSIPCEDMCKWLTHDNIEGTNCCVCSVHTQGMPTPCGHNVCLVCFDNIKTVLNEDDNIRLVLCPLCREPIGRSE